MTHAVERPTTHWADRIAAELVARDREAVISTGISPSGDFHVGHLREVVTADAIRRALKDRGLRPRLNFVSDNYDPLRKAYPFLDPGTYGPLVGKPLSEIPCPCGHHESYGEHFLLPFLESLRRLRVEVELERADRMYKSGRMTPLIVCALEARDRIVSILRELTGKEMSDDWSPFTPICDVCGRMTRTRVLGFSAADETVRFECGCGGRGTVPMAGGGKLVWRIDWPARWKLLGVTVEPFGKDHSTRGGSYDTGARIAREVFGIEPPYPIPYEWINLRGRGDMSSSKGNVLAIDSVLEVVPPEVLRYLVIRERPHKRITFDPGLPLLQLVDEVDRATADGRDDRALELSHAGGFRPVGVPYRHLVVVAQIARFDLDRVLEILGRTGYEALSRDAVADRLGYARRWLESFAPDDVRFEVVADVPAEAASLTGDQRSFLGRLADRLADDLDAAAIHELIYNLSREYDETPSKSLFEAIYVALLGKPRGPRAASFIATLGPSFCARRFREVAEEHR